MWRREKNFKFASIFKKSLSQSNSALKTEPELFANIKKKKIARDRKIKKNWLSIQCLYILFGLSYCIHFKGSFNHLSETCRLFFLTVFWDQADVNQMRTALPADVVWRTYSAINPVYTVTLTTSRNAAWTGKITIAVDAGTVSTIKQHILTIANWILIYAYVWYIICIYVY